MNVWMKRTAGVVMISAGLVAAGATAASAADKPDIDKARQSIKFEQNASTSANSTSTFNNFNYQKGLAPVNVTAGNVNYSEANAITLQEGSKFFRSPLTNLAGFR